MSARRPFHIAVVGPGRDVPAGLLEAAEQIGALVAGAGDVVVTGGLGGVMEAAARGAGSVGGTVLGLLPGTERDEANEFVTVAVPTGLGELRNALVVRAADAVICVGGSWGTLSEVALARRAGVPVVSLAGWEVRQAGGDPVEGAPLLAASAAEAVELARRAAQRGPG